MRVVDEVLIAEILERSSDIAQLTLKIFSLAAIMTRKYCGIVQLDHDPGLPVDKLLCTTADVLGARIFYELGRLNLLQSDLGSLDSCLFTLVCSRASILPAKVPCRPT